jgi:hypothetical protein
MNDDSTFTAADAVAEEPPVKRARRCLAKKVGEPVEVRLSAGVWTTMSKPRSRRGKFYVQHLRDVLAQLEARGVPATKGNLRRLAAGRGARLRAALAEIATNAAQDDTEATMGPDASTLRLTDQL